MSRLITDILRDVRKGAAVEEATNALSDVVRAVDETGKKGAVTIVVNVVPAPHGGPEKQIIVEVKSKKPIASIAPAVFFSDQDGDLHRADPTQEDMKFAPAEAKSASA